MAGSPSPWGAGFLIWRSASNQPSEAPFLEVLRCRIGSLRQRLAHNFRLAGNHGEISPCGLIGLGGALLPISQCSKGDMVMRGELFLSASKRTSDELSARHALRLGKISSVQGCASGSARAAASISASVIGRIGRGSGLALRVLLEVVIFVARRTKSTECGPRARHKRRSEVGLRPCRES